MKTIILSGGDHGGEAIDVLDTATEITVGDCVYRIEGDTGIFTGKV